jgi:hypothetical protein
LGSSSVLFFKRLRESSSESRSLVQQFAVELLRTGVINVQTYVTLNEAFVGLRDFSSVAEKTKINETDDELVNELERELFG